MEIIFENCFVSVWLVSSTRHSPFFRFGRQKASFTALVDPPLYLDAHHPSEP